MHTKSYISFLFTANPTKVIPEVSQINITSTLLENDCVDHHCLPTE